MRTFLKLLLTVTALFGLTIAVFSAYTHLLVDYSLENLHAAIAVTESKTPGASALTNHVYGSLVEDLAVREATKGEGTSFKDFALLQMASRSFEEAASRGGYQQARVYLDTLVKERTGKKSAFLRFSDSINTSAVQLVRSVKGISHYFQKNLAKKAKKKESSDYATEVILSQAQIQERLGNFTEATAIYRKFISENPGHPNRGMASITLANILIKQSRNLEAQKILQEIRSGYPGLEEGDLAERFLRKIDYLKRGADLVPRLKTLAASEKDPAKRDKLRLKLALAEISLYQLEAAQKILEEIQTTQDSRLRGQAKFYLAWVYRLRQQYGEGIKLLVDLLDDPDLARDLALGLHVELADIYSVQKNPGESLKHYQTLVKSIQKELTQLEKTQKSFQEKKALDSAWLALGELGQANVYFFDYQDTDKANEHLNRLAQVLGDDSSVLDIEKVRQVFSGVSNQSLRDRAFHALEARQIGLAYDLLMQNLAFSPADAWTYAGLSTIYVLLGDLNSAIEYGEKSYQLGQDEYTASALGYVYGLGGRYSEAVRMYQRAVQSRKPYLPARFNLGWMYLKLQDYQKAAKIFKNLEASDGVKLNYVVRAKVLNNLGYAAWKMGDREGARGYFVRAMKENPNFKIAEKNLNLVQTAG